MFKAPPGLHEVLGLRAVTGKGRRQGGGVQAGDGITGRERESALKGLIPQKGALHRDLLIWERGIEGSPKFSSPAHPLKGARDGQKGVLQDSRHS